MSATHAGLSSLAINRAVRSRRGIDGRSIARNSRSDFFESDRPRFARRVPHGAACGQHTLPTPTLCPRLASVRDRWTHPNRRSIRSPRAYRGHRRAASALFCVMRHRTSQPRDATKKSRTMHSGSTKCIMPPTTATTADHACAVASPHQLGHVWQERQKHLSLQRT